MSGWEIRVIATCMLRAMRMYDYTEMYARLEASKPGLDPSELAVQMRWGYLAACMLNAADPEFYFKLEQHEDQVGSVLARLLNTRELEHAKHGSI